MYDQKGKELLAKVVRELQKVDIRYWSIFYVDSISKGGIV